MSEHFPTADKPDRSMAARFFGNAFVQTVLVFVALAAGFSGKLDRRAATVAILFGWAIGSIGIYTHCPATRTKRAVAAGLILLLGAALWLFNGYLTRKNIEPVVAQQMGPAPANLGNPQQPKPSEPSRKPVHRHVSSAAQPQGPITTGPITQGPCSSTQIGGSNNQSTVNCWPPSRALDTSKTRQLTNDLSNIPTTTVYIFASGVSQDVQPLLTQLCSAFLDAQWHPNCQGVNSMLGGVHIPIVDGVQCYSTDWSTGTSARIKTALDDAGLRCSYIDQSFTSQTMTLGGVTIVIGSQTASVKSSVATFDHLNVYGGTVGVLNCSDNVTFKNSMFAGGQTGLINDPDGKADCRSDRSLYVDLLSQIKRDAGSKTLIERDFDALRVLLNTPMHSDGPAIDNERLANLAELEAAFLKVADDRQQTLDLLPHVQLNDINPQTGP